MALMMLRVSDDGLVMPSTCPRDGLVMPGPGGWGLRAGHAAGAARRHPVGHRHLAAEA